MGFGVVIECVVESEVLNGYVLFFGCLGVVLLIGEMCWV